jgi:hypothetical protein
VNLYGPARRYPEGELSMRAFLVTVLVVIVIVVGLGFYLGWFQIHTTRDSDNKVHVTLDVNRNKIDQDTQKAREGAAKVGNQVTEGVKKAAGNVAKAINTHRAKGDVVSVAEADSRVTVRTEDNKTLTVKAEPTTKIRRNGVEAGMDSLTQGDHVLIEYREENGDNVASSITVRPGTE